MRSAKFRTEHCSVLRSAHGARDLLSRLARDLHHLFRLVVKLSEWQLGEPAARRKWQLAKEAESRVFISGWR